jgi:hypothetical protein
VSERSITEFTLPRTPLNRRERRLEQICALLERDDVLLVILTDPAGRYGTYN